MSVTAKSSPLSEIGSVLCGQRCVTTLWQRLRGRPTEKLLPRLISSLQWELPGKALGWISYDARANICSFRIAGIHTRIATNFKDESLHSFLTYSKVLYLNWTDKDRGKCKIRKEIISSLLDRNRGIKRRFPSRCIENTSKAMQSTFNLDVLDP